MHEAFSCVNTAESPLSSDRKQSVCCHSSVVLQSQTTSGQRERGARVFESVFFLFCTVALIENRTAFSFNLTGPAGHQAAL